MNQILTLQSGQYKKNTSGAARNGSLLRKGVDPIRIVGLTEREKRRGCHLAYHTCIQDGWTEKNVFCCFVTNDVSSLLMQSILQCKALFLMTIYFLKAGGNLNMKKFSIGAPCSHVKAGISESWRTEETLWKPEHGRWKTKSENDLLSTGHIVARGTDINNRALLSDPLPSQSVL